MDNYEYRMRTDEMRSFVEAGEYDKAMEIANQIDWRRVKSVPMLCLVSEIYENMKSYQVSRDILFLAYDRQPASRKIVYRLGILAIKIGDFNEAKDCYEEFIRLAPRDPNQFILRYKTLKAMEAPIEEQIDALRAFKKSEYVEKWAYELALLYQKAGMIRECIAECDDLILWFSEGRYVYKAMELKMRYKPLSEDQQVKFDKRFEREETPVKKPLLKHEAAQRLFAEKVLSPAGKISMPAEKSLTPAEDVDVPSIGKSEKKEKFDGSITGTMKIEEILAEWEKTTSEMKTEIDKTVEETGAKKDIATEIKEEKIQTLSEDIRKLLDDLEAEERGEDVDFADEESAAPDVPEEAVPEEESFDEEEDFDEEESFDEEEDFDEEEAFEEIEEIAEPEEEENGGKTMVYTASKNAAADMTLEEENAEKTEGVIYRPADYKVPDAERLSLRMTDAIDFDTDDEKLREIYAKSDILPEEGMEKDVIYRPADYKVPDAERLSLMLADAIDFDSYDEKLREDFISECGATKLFEAPKENIVLDMADAEDVDEPVLRMEDAEDLEKQESAEDVVLMLSDAEDMDRMEAVEEVPDEEKIIRKSPGGVVLDTAFKVQGRYDLSATSVVGTKAGLTPEQKKIFSYFVPVRGMSSQLYKVLENDKTNEQRYGTSRTGNILISGDKGNGKTVLAINIMKAIQKNRGNEKASAAIIKAEALNTKDVEEIVSRLNAGGLIIEKASLMDRRTVKDLNKALEGQTGEMVVVLEDDKRSLEKLLHRYPALQRKFTSKVSIPAFINDELVTFAQTYAAESGCRIDEMGILALYSCIDTLQTEDHFVTVTEVKEIMDRAIAHARHSGVKHFFTTALKTGNEEITIKEEDIKC